MPVESIRAWVWVQTVRDWQILGAHHVRRELPARFGHYGGDYAHDYAALFGRSTASVLDWLQIKTTYGSETPARVQGAAPAEFGCGAATSGFIEVNSRADMESWTPDSIGLPAQVDEVDVCGLP